MKKIIEILTKSYKTGFFDIFLANIINKVLAFCNSIFIVRVLSKNDFGLYSYSQNLLSLFLIVSGLGINSGLLQYGSKAKSLEEKDMIFKYSLKRGCIVNIFLMILIIVYTKIGFFKIEEGRSILLLMSGIPIFSIIIELLIFNYRIRLKNREMAFFSVGNTFFTIVFMIFFGYLWGIKGIILGRYMGMVLIIFLVIKELKLKELKILFPLKLKKEINHFSFMSMVNSSIILFIHTVDLFIIGTFIGDRNIIATYKVANTIPFALEFIPSSVMTYLYPYFVRNNTNRDWLNNKYKQVIIGLTIFNFCLVILLIIFSKNIIFSIFGNKYSEAINIFKILCIGYFFTGSFRVVGANLLFIMNKIKFNMYSSIIACIMNILLNIIFIPKYGSIGAAYATMGVFFIWGLVVNFFTIYNLRHMK